MPKSTKALILSAITLLSLSSCSINVHHHIGEYLLSYDISTHMNTNGEFKILQLTDTHIGDKDNQDIHYAFMDSVITAADADMIVITGDLFTFAGRATARRFFKFLDSYNIPWTVTYGNHDEQCYFSVDWLSNYLNKFGSNCLFKDLQDDDVMGNTNFAINLMHDGNIFEQVIIMDSNRYYYGSYFGYDYFKQNQIDWYSDLIDYTSGLNNNNVVESLMFYHIPLPEIDDAYEYGETHPEAKLGGEKREKTCPPEINTGFFEKIKEKGSTKAMFFGHDHRNTFAVKYEGVIFSYGVHSTNRIYFDEDMLGGQVITLKSDHSIELNRIYKTY